MDYIIQQLIRIRFSIPYAFKIMDIQQKNQQVQSLFQQANEPNIYFIDFQFNQCLETLKIKNINSQTSIKIMMDLINAILYLKTNKLNPCQIKFIHVGCDKDKNWGLKHAVCYRSKIQTNNIYSYDATQYIYHENEDNQLIWNLGKIWLRFYVDRKISITETNQNQIDQIVDKNVTDFKIGNIIKKMLCIKKDKRISFQKFVEDSVFAVQNSHQNLYSSICLHFNFVSKNQKVKNSLNNKKQIKNPFEEQIFRRDMEEALDIVYLLQKSTQIIKNIYQKSADIQFSIFIIKAEAYCMLKNLDQKKNNNEIKDYTMNQKKLYSKFVTKMLTLKHQLQRKTKMKIFYNQDGLNQSQKQFLIPTEEMTLKKIHGMFKTIVVQYYCQAIKQLKQVAEKPVEEDIKRKQFCIIQKRSLIFLLTRLCNQIFSQLRSYIFQQFIQQRQDGLKMLTIRDLIQFIDRCNDPIPLKLLRKRVYENGLTPAAESNKRIEKQK